MGRSEWVFCKVLMQGVAMNTLGLYEERSWGGCGPRQNQSHVYVNPRFRLWSGHVSTVHNSISSKTALQLPNSSGVAHEVGSSLPCLSSFVPLIHRSGFLSPTHHHPISRALGSHTCTQLYPASWPSFGPILLGRLSSCRKASC